MNFLNRYADTIYCIARLIIGLMFACHGGQKILNYPPGGHGHPDEMMGWVGAWIELAGGFMVALGLLTRIGALFASGEMAVAYFMVHAKMGYFPIQNHGEPAVYYCMFFLFVFFYGAGHLSIDALMSKNKAAPAVA